MLPFLAERWQKVRCTFIMENVLKEDFVAVPFDAGCSVIFVSLLREKVMFIVYLASLV